MPAAASATDMPERPPSRGAGPCPPSPPNFTTRTWAVLAVAGVVILLYYWGLLTDGGFLLAPRIRLGLMFNSMIEYLARGRFDIDPDVIDFEGFTRDHHTYAYFGVMPALLRAPILWFPRLRAVDFTVMACAVATALTAVAQLLAVLRCGRALGNAPHARRIVWLASAMFIFGGAQVQFLRPTIYQESEFWASAIAAFFTLLAFQWCIDPAARTLSRLVTMAVLAGVCLLTRVSTSIGLYAACGGIMLTLVLAAARRGGSGIAARRGDLGVAARGALRMILAPSLILLTFAAICGYINYQRWESPFTFQDYRYYNLLSYDSPVFEVLYNYGFFSFHRIPFGLSYFFFPVWAIIRPDGHFLFRELQDRLYLFVEFPPASFLLSDTLLCFLSVLGGLWLARRRTGDTGVTAARMIAAAFAIPGILMLMAIALTLRYRMEFYQLFDFLALFGLFGLAEKMARRPRAMTTLCVAMLAISIVFSNFFLFSYKIMEGGDTKGIEKVGWVAVYRAFLRVPYPRLDRMLWYEERQLQVYH